MPNGGDRTMAFTAWLSGPSGTPGGVGSHDPHGQLKMMPVQLGADCIKAF